jgi:hypothetical protein
VTDADRREPAGDKAPHALPRHVAELAAPAQGPVPVATDLVAKSLQRWAVGGHTVIAYVPSDDRPQPLSHLFQRIMHAPPKLQLDLPQLRPHALPDRLPQHRERSLAGPSANMRKPQKIERRRLSLAALEVLGPLEPAL